MLDCYSVWTCIPRLASMDFRQIRTFRCVAELGSLSKAADKLRIAQPALSRQIKLLEHELRTGLVRFRRPVGPRGAGVCSDRELRAVRAAGATHGPDLSGHLALHCREL